MAGGGSLHGWVAHVAGGMHGWGQAWLGACMACMAGGPCMAGCEAGHAPLPFGWQAGGTHPTGILTFYIESVDMPRDSKLGCIRHC